MHCPPGLKAYISATSGRNLCRGLQPKPCSVEGLKVAQEVGLSPWLLVAPTNFYGIFLASFPPPPLGGVFQHNHQTCRREKPMSAWSVSMDEKAETVILLVWWFLQCRGRFYRMLCVSFFLFLYPEKARAAIVILCFILPVGLVCDASLKVWPPLQPDKPKLPFLVSVCKSQACAALSSGFSSSKVDSEISLLIKQTVACSHMSGRSAHWVLLYSHCKCTPWLGMLPPPPESCDCGTGCPENLLIYLLFFC